MRTAIEKTPADFELVRDTCQAYFGATLEPFDQLPRDLFRSERKYVEYFKRVLFFTKFAIEPLERKGMKRGHSIVDIASGDGQMSLALYLKGYRNVTLFDLDEARLQFGVRMIKTFADPSAEVEHVNDTATNYHGHHDVLITCQTIEHLSDTGNYSVASRRCQKVYLRNVNEGVSQLCYLNAPNLAFPIDGHDTSKPLFHYLPARFRRWLIDRNVVKCSWSGVAQPVSVGFLNRHLPDFTLASNYYAFDSWQAYVQNRPPFSYMGVRLNGNGRPNWKKKVISTVANTLGKNVQRLLPVLSLIYARR